MDFDLYKEVAVEQNGRNYDPDSSPEAWTYYKTVYKMDRWDLLKGFDMENRRSVKNKADDGKIYWREQSQITITSAYYGDGKGKIGPVFKLGGETDFNFNEKKLLLLTSIANNNAEAIASLAECAKRHHMLVNFSLIAVSGNMQGQKSKGCCVDRYGEPDWLDRLDSFIYMLNEYFSNGKEYVLLPKVDEFGRPNPNRDCLIEFLATFDGVFDYCRKVYFLEGEEGRELVKCMIENGSKPILNAGDVKRYTALAQDYWKQKEQCLVSITK